MLSLSLNPLNPPSPLKPLSGPLLAGALAALALTALPIHAGAYGRFVRDNGCPQVAEHVARIHVEGGVVTTDVQITLAQGGNVFGGDAEVADAEPSEVIWYLRARGDAPKVVVDGQPVQVDLLDIDDAVAEAMQRADEQGDPSLLDISDEPVWRARLGLSPARVEVRESHPHTTERGVGQIVHPVRTCAGGGRLSVEATFADGSPATVLSPYHTLALEQLDGGTVVARHDSFGANHFDLHLYSASADVEAGADVGSGLVSFRDPSCDPDAPGFFALTAGPRPGAAAEKPTRPKDVVLVVDSSGSMGGEKIDQARGALDHVLTGLGEQDRFEVVDFDSRVQSLFGGLEEASASRIEDARAFVRRLDAGGGTFIEGGLSEGLGALRNRTADDAGRPAFVVFATDGQATNGVTDRQGLIDLATAANLAEARLFPFGIGYDVNAFLLDGLAAANHGVSSFIRPGADIELAIASFYEQIRTPVMTDLELGAVGAKPSALVPDELPDVFDGSQVLLVGTYTAGDPAGLALLGDLDGDGRLSSVPPSGGLVTSGTAHGFVPRLWATRRVAQLIDWDRKTPGDEARVAEIERLANRFGLVTPWTQFVKDGEGNVSNSYARPDGGESGAQAVGHSSDNNDMRGTFNAGDYAGGDELQSLVRHRAERTFVVRDLRWWDTSLADDAPLHDVTYGSPAWKRLVRQAPELRRWLAIGHDVVFRVGCEGLRVSWPEREDLPAESLGVDSLGERVAGEATPAWAEVAEVTGDDSDGPSMGLDPFGGGAGADGEQGIDEPNLVKDVGCSCEIANNEASPWSWALLLGLALLSTRRTMRPWLRTASTSRGSTNGTAPSSFDGPGRS